MNRPVKATDIVNFVMLNGDCRPLLVVRSWDTVPATAASVIQTSPVPMRPGEQVKFPGHSQAFNVPVQHIAGVLFVDPSVDGDNVPKPPQAGDPGPDPALAVQTTTPAAIAAQRAKVQIAQGALSEAQATNNASPTEATGNAVTTAEKDLAAAQKKLYWLESLPTSPTPAAATPAQGVVGTFGGDFQAWIESAAFDEAGKVPGTWHWARGY